MKQAASGSESKQYWLDRLADRPTVGLPLDRPRSPVQSFGRGTVSMALQAGPKDATPFVSVCSALATVLSRYGGQADVTLGAVALAGDTANVVPLRIDVDPRSSVEALASHVAVVLGEAARHCEYPFDVLLGDLEDGESGASDPPRLFEA
ncbi:MAG: hypothetical protein ACR2QM_18670, partial [Longimicrobiales bacterium]